MKSLQIKQERFNGLKVFVDGQEMKDVISLKFEMEANNFSCVTIESLVLNEVQVEI